MLTVFVSQAQQTPSDLVETDIITTENVSDLQLITTLGEGQLYAIDWHPDGEVLALARGSGICLLDESLEITECFYGIDVPYDLAWNSTGTQLAIIASSGLHVWDFNSSTHEFTENESPAAIDGNCVAWNTDEEIVVAEFIYEGHIDWSATYNLVFQDTIFSEGSGTDDYMDLLESRCRADIVNPAETLFVSTNYAVGRSYDTVFRGDDEWNLSIWESAGEMKDVSWHMPGETFTYIAGNQLVEFSLLLDAEGEMQRTVLRVSIPATDYTNTLRWSPDGNRLLSGDNYGNIVYV